ncbi:hypothetical protein IWZ01DRAFT_478901 [Phyllosticta capitalensis]
MTISSAQAAALARQSRATSGYWVEHVQRLSCRLAIKNIALRSAPLSSTAGAGRPASLQAGSRDCLRWSVHSQTAASTYLSWSGSFDFNFGRDPTSSDMTDMTIVTGKTEDYTDPHHHHYQTMQAAPIVSSQSAASSAQLSHLSIDFKKEVGLQNGPESRYNWRVLKDTEVQKSESRDMKTPSFAGAGERRRGKVVRFYRRSSRGAWAVLA